MTTRDCWAIQTTFTRTHSLSRTPRARLLYFVWARVNSGFSSVNFGNPQNLDFKVSILFYFCDQRSLQGKKPFQIKRYKNWRWKQHVYLVTLHSVTADVLPVDFLEIKLTAQTGDLESPSLVITWNGTEHNEIYLVETIISESVEEKIIPSFTGDLWRTSWKNIRRKSQRIVDR